MSSKIYFIADVHLEKGDLQKRDLFLAFVKMVKGSGDLFILGDLFDYWANNRKVMRDNQVVCDALCELAHNGAKVGFLIGNRDLLLGEKVLSRYGIDYLGESKRLTLQGKSLLLTHGHLLYTDDVEFQRYRRTKWPIYKALDALLPGFIENALAKLFILRSKQVIEAQEPWRLQFSENEIKKIFNQGVEAIICGHSHQAMIEKYDADKYFIVLPSWNSSRGGYLCMEGGNFQVKDFPVDQNPEQ
jgi:UDP-2,3-diacylglucosamine hydrolase